MQDLFSLADDNGDGLISFDEFRAMFVSEVCSRPAFPFDLVFYCEVTYRCVR